MSKYRRIIKVGQKKDYSKILAILFLCVFVFIGFSYVNKVNKKDEQIINNYRKLCGDDYESEATQICFRDVYYQYND